MKSNAAGQLLGYSLQFPRALFHLLTCSPDDCVSIEVVGDVATKKSDDSLITEEDKSSIVGNPITNKSIDLWKTLFNWIKAINDGDIDVNVTKFILFCNQTGQCGIVDIFSLATNKDTASAAIETAKNKLSDIKKDHAIWEYFNYTVNTHQNILAEVIQRFELQIGKGASYGGLREELQKKHIAPSQVEFVLHGLSGWLQENILTKIAANNSAIVSWEEFDHKFQVLFDRSRRRELIDFTLQSIPDSDQIDSHLKIRPTYIRQLDIIGMNDDEVVRAVSDYMRAEINRAKWIEDEIIDENVAQEFENKLSSYCRNKAKKIEITQSSLSHQDKGQLLYSDCMMRNEMIRGESPPDSTISGTYHALADKPILGWHSDWKKKLKEQGS
ncbi:MAG: hypothetical protein QM500_11505 [Methylococcales bacterium]